MNILDCETLESTYESIENILGLTENTLKSVFDEMISIGFEDFREEFCSKIAPIPCSIDFICWFHITRIGINTDFSDGILPLYLGVEKIWNFLYSLAENDFAMEDWVDFKNKMNSCQTICEIKESPRKLLIADSHSLYYKKTTERIQGGPWALHIREMAFIQNSSVFGKFLEIPEIVADICNVFDDVYQYNLRERYINSTKSCIVKFKSQNNCENCLVQALYYSYCKRKNYDLTEYSVFNSGGELIPEFDILKIEWLE